MPLGPFYELICVTESEMILPAKNCDESAIRCNFVSSQMSTPSCDVVIDS